jgi:hypothetical protein
MEESSMNLAKKLLTILVFIMIFVVLCMSQVTPLVKVTRDDLGKAEIEKWLDSYTNLIFDDMNPGGAFDTYCFLGRFTKKEFEMGLEGISTNKNLPKGYLKRYLRVNFERSFYELFFSMGTKGFVENFTQASFDNNGFTTISNVEYSNQLASILVKHKISKADFIQFFKQDNRAVTKIEIFHLELAFDDLLSAIKSKINEDNYNENAGEIKAMWEIRDDIDDKRYSLVVNKWAGSFVIGKKNKRIQILDFPTAID